MVCSESSTITYRCLIFLPNLLKGQLADHLEGRLIQLPLPQRVGHPRPLSTDKILDLDLSKRLASLVLQGKYRRI